jgi:hypothetical protein
MTNHKSHHIFIYLGILILLFALVFGMKYFKSLYSFEETGVTVAEQNYDAGALTESPFVPVEVGGKENIPLNFTYPTDISSFDTSVLLSTQENLLLPSLGKYIKYRNLIANQIKEQGINFAGKYHVISVPNGPENGSVYIFNLETGQQLKIDNIPALSIKSHPRSKNLIVYNWNSLPHDQTDEKIFYWNEVTQNFDISGLKDSSKNCLFEDNLDFCVEVVHSNDPNKPTPNDVSITVEDSNGNSQKIYSIDNLGMSLASANYLEILSLKKNTDDIYEIIFVEGLSGYGESDPKIIEYSKSSGFVDLSKELSSERTEEYILARFK